MNPNLDRAKAYLRKGKQMFTPIKDGQRELEKEHESINQAKRRSRELMKMGFVIVTKEGS